MMIIEIATNNSSKIFLLLSIPSLDLWHTRGRHTLCWVTPWPIQLLPCPPLTSWTLGSLFLALTLSSSLYSNLTQPNITQNMNLISYLVFDFYSYIILNITHLNLQLSNSLTALLTYVSCFSLSDHQHPVHKTVAAARSSPLTSPFTIKIIITTYSTQGSKKKQPL